MTSCYRLRDNNNIDDVSNADSPCAAPPDNSSLYVPCCAHGDQCLQYGTATICHYTHSLTGGSGYYAGGCTDPTFRDASCNKHCGNLDDQEIVYNDTDSLWRCCGSTNGTNGPLPTCQNPTNETFQAAAPNALATYSLQVPTTAGPNTAASTTPSSNQGASSSSVSLGAGALAGIIVGSIVGGGILLALALFALRRIIRKRRRQGVNIDPPAFNDRSVEQGNWESRKVEPQTGRPQEIYGKRLRPELGLEGAKHELPAD